MLRMIRKVISTFMIAVLVTLPVAVIVGCEKEETIHTERQVEIKDQVIDQHTVVQ